MRQLVSRIAMAALILEGGAAVAQSRVIEETLVVKDPTVAPAGRGVFGASVEALYVNAPFKNRVNTDGTLEDGRAKATSAGGNVFAGVGDFTAAFTYRNARGQSTLTHEVSASEPVRYQHRVEAVPKQEEIFLRWLGRGLSTSWLTPYLYVGYTRLNSDFDDIRETGTWAATGTNRLRSKVESKAFIGGLGGIVPFSESFGFRGDIGVIRARQSTDRQGDPHAEGTGTGSRWTGTFYYNVTQNVNAQLGARYEYFNGGRAGSMTIAGIFAMVGFTFK
ncbi:MAG TPA: hypothetical protein VM051_09750 [Usitatibacter sp.]|nr:hypothetical protein [Usitatibacter sp.]